MRDDFQPERRGEADERPGGYRGGYSRQDDDREMRGAINGCRRKNVPSYAAMSGTPGEIYPPRRR